MQLPNLSTYLRDLLPVHLIQGKGFVDPSLRVNPAQGVQQNVELPSTTTDHDQIGTTAMLQYTTEESPFGGDLTIPFAQDIHGIEKLKAACLVIEFSAHLQL